MELLSFWGKHRFTLIIIFVAVFVYFNMLFNGFVWDDGFLVVDNQYVHSLSKVWKYFTHEPYSTQALKSPEGFYRPLTYLYFSIIYTISSHPFVFHVSQLIIHIINSILLLKLLTIFVKRKIAFPLTLLFVVHPISVEAVAYISATQDILSVTFGLGAIHIMRKEIVKYYHVIFSSLFLLCSILLRESGIFFIISVLLYSYFFNKKNILYYIYSVGATVITYAVSRFLIAKVFYFGQTISPIMALSLPDRLINIPKIIFHYITTFIFPFELTTSRLWVVKLINFRDFYFPLLVDIIVFSFLIYLGFMFWKKHKKIFTYYLFFLLWLVIDLGSYLNILPLDFTVTERWFYSIMIGVLGIIGLVIQEIKINRKLIQISFVGFILLIMLLSVRTIVRNMDWQNKWTLYSNDIQISKDSFDLYTNYGIELVNKGQYDEAIRSFEKSNTLAPYTFINYSNMGVAFTRKNDYTKAEESFNKSIKENNRFYVAYQNLAYLYMQKGEYKKAKRTIEKGLIELPSSIPLLVYLSKAEYKLNNREAATKAAYRVYELEPSQLNFQIYSLLKDGRELNF